MAEMIEEPEGRWRTGLSWVREASALLTAELGPGALAARALELAVAAIPCREGSVDLVAAEPGVLIRAAVYDGAGVRPVVPGTPVRRSAHDAGARARLEVPLVAHDPSRIEGYLVLGREHPETFTARDEAIAATLGTYLAAALANDVLFTELRRSESRLRQLIEGSWDGIATFGLDAELISVSGHLFAATGLTPEEVVRRGWRVVVDPEDHDTLAAALRAAAGGTSGRLRFRYRNAQGRPSTAEAVVSPISEEGRVTSVLAIVRDIAIALEQERRFRESEKLAAVGRTIAGIAHDLNGPLTSVRGLCQLLHDEIQDERLREDLDVLVREADLAARIVDGLLAFVRRKKPEPQAIDLNLLVGDLGRRPSDRATKRRIRMEVTQGDDLPPVAGDPVQLDRVFRNLIRNAEDALLEVERDRRITLRTESAPGRVRVSIADNGPGITAELLDSIFEPLVTTKREGEGTGFGLAIAREVVEAHGGTIRVEATPGGGATFVVDLPVTDVAHLARPRTEAMPRPAGPGKDVLVIDDDPAIRRVFRRLLEPRGHTVVEAGDSDEALALLIEGGRRYDRIFMDNQMPGMSGATLFERLATIPEVARVVTFITGDASNPETLAFIARAGRPHVPKPFALIDILRAVEEPVPAAPNAE